MQLVRDLGILLARAAVVHNEVHVASQQPFVDVSFPVEKLHHSPIEETAVPRG